MHPCHSGSILALITLVGSMVGIPAGPCWYSLELFQPTSEGVLCCRGTVKNVLTTVVCSFHICSLKVGIVSAVGREATVSSSFYSSCDLALGRRTEKKTFHGSKYQLFCSCHISLFGNTGVQFDQDSWLADNPLLVLQLMICMVARHTQGIPIR